MSTPLVNSSPHWRSEDNVRIIMADVLLALLPALIAGCYYFGMRVLTLSALSVLSCLLFDALGAWLCGRRPTVSDGSAAVSGVLLAFTLPVSVPLWVPVLGAAFAMLLVKQLFGGLGKNLVNPALAARIFLTISFPDLLTAYTLPFAKFSPFAWQPEVIDTVTTATPLAALNAGSLPENLSLTDVLLGSVGGCIGEVSALMLLGGGLYLLYRRVIRWQIPAAFLGTVALLGLLFPVNSTFLFRSVLFELCSGGLILGAVFMATDYTTSPVTGTGRLIFGVGCGLLTFLIRRFGGYPEGVSFAILMMNFLVWPLDKLTRPRPPRPAQISHRR